MENSFSKLKHDIHSDINSIFECCELLLQSSDISEDMSLGLNLMLNKKEGLSQNIEKLFDLLKKPS